MKTLHLKLKALQEQATKLLGLNLRVGICSNLNLDQREYEAMQRLIIKWHGSEEEALACFPVEGSFEAYAEAADACTLWDNPKRLELLNYLVENSK